LQVNALDKDGATPLHLASKNGHTETASMLITLGATVEILDSDNLTPLCAATVHGHTETATALVALGGDVGSQCRTRSGVYTPVPRSALEIARDQGDEEMVRQLIASGASAEGAAAQRER
jgi:ankyrin repeat protein